MNNIEYVNHMIINLYYYDLLIPIYVNHHLIVIQWNLYYLINLI